MRITKHAMDRIAQRQITKEQLIECLTNGKIYENKWDANKWTYVHTGINLYIVTNKDRDVIISVFRKEK